ncbi:Uncharacterised protein [Candidatus Ornithobacterium hominis]|uniref:Lipoprotein n=1 Tax=Candidatus Ornithobacterium hominis TaxID=2497989 RepID=A0A383TXF1_9FLAO|nr:hypothetical protein [Candidatus Ornithobacterium hominis]MCT7904138.1 hypothetical protein [Candidatus Ornithobacterium hominis]SZD72322.1 Uncharacterised protein [Candidatus Ornithobacterium hominis]
MMKKLFLLGFAVVSLSSCLNEDDGLQIQNRHVAFDNISLDKETVKTDENFNAIVYFKYNPSCERLYQSYYYVVKDFERTISPMAQVNLKKTCDNTKQKSVIDTLKFKFSKPGKYTLRFYKGHDAEKKTSFFEKKIVVESKAIN